MSEIPSMEEIQRVREHECRMSGHDFTVLGVWQVEGPHAVTCSHCGKGWTVPADEADLATAAHLLDQAWDWLAEQGKCDSRGGAEYQRIVGALLPLDSDRPSGQDSA